jgi:hypothetical protein
MTGIKAFAVAFNGTTFLLGFVKNGHALQMLCGREMQMVR